MNLATVATAPAAQPNGFQTQVWDAIGDVDHLVDTLQTPAARPLFEEALGEASMSVNALYQLQSTPAGADAALAAVDLLATVGDRYMNGQDRTPEGFDAQLGELTQVRALLVTAFAAG